jgi:divalent metal cation (Fe/Co/Zn/Cd) transporter
VPGRLVGEEPPVPELVRSALRVSAASAVWTLTASIAAILIGLADGSLALIAFGAVQLFDFAADVVLVIHFRRGADAEHLERIVLRVVAVGLVATGLTTAIVSTSQLLSHGEAHGTTAGLVLAAASLIALTALAIRKRHIANRLPSHALRADGNLTAVGATLAAVTLVGAAATTLFGWWWADPAAALTIAAVATGVGARTRP